MSIFVAEFACESHFFVICSRFGESRKSKWTWRDARVAEEARLESVYTSKAYQGFESPSLRCYPTKDERKTYIQKNMHEG